MSGQLMGCIIPSTILIIIFGFVALIRWFEHREIMAMVEKGMLPKQHANAPRGRNGRGLLGWGIALAMLGLALMIGLWPLGFTRLIAMPGTDGGNAYPLHFGPWMLIGLIPLFVGLALLIFYFVTRKEEVPAPEASGEQVEDIGN
ncbi:MAG: DUF6249 domain-containing protein [Chloroflexota bacterium]|nr:DUF6249 domain-containing protein [Chloroflexota bacterium]